MINSVPEKNRRLSKEIEDQTKFFISRGGKVNSVSMDSRTIKNPKAGDFTLSDGERKKPTDPKKVK